MSGSQGIIAGVLAILLAVVSALLVRGKTKAESGDLISQSAVRLVESMEVRVKAQEEKMIELEKTVEALRAEASEMKIARSADKYSILELKRQVAWLHDRLPDHEQKEFSKVFPGHYPHRDNA